MAGPEMSDVRFYVDVHLDAQITRALRTRGVDVLTTQDDGRGTLPDDQLLHRATELGRVLVTYDNDFWALADEWQRQERLFSGIINIPSGCVTIGDTIEELEAIAKASTPDEWLNRMDRIPLTY